MSNTRRDDIVVAATELFAQHGFHAVGMRAIADAVGIRGSSLYHHFDSKTELLYAIAHDYNRAFIESQLADLTPNPTYAQRIRTLVRDHIIYFHEHRLEEAVGLRELQELRDNAPEHYVEIQRWRRSYQDALEELIVRGREAGELDCDDPHLMVLAVLGMINSVNDWFRESGRRSIFDVADAYAEITVGRILGAG